MYEEVNTGTNLPAQIDLFATDGDEYKFLFMAKGGGSANKTFLYQQTKALLNPASLMKFLDAKIRTLGTAACPPYHLAIVIGGTSAEMTLKTVKLASARYLDGLPGAGSKHGQAFRDLELEQAVLEMTRAMGIGAQFGGKYFCHDVRVIRLPRHGASLPGRHRRLLLGRPQHPGQDHARTASSSRSWRPTRPLPARHRAVEAGRRGGQDRPDPADGRDPPHLSQVPDPHPGVAHRHRSSSPATSPTPSSRSAWTAARACPTTSSRCPVYYAGPAKTPAGMRLGLVRPHHRRPHGLLRRPVPVPRRLAWS